MTLDDLQWPAMAITVISVWWIGSESASARAWGFWGSLLGNALWIVWGFHDRAWALIGMQAGLVALNLRGAVKNEKEKTTSETASSQS